MKGSKNSALSSSVWTIGVKFVERGLALVTYIILARFLSVEEFGVVAFALLFLEFITVLIGSGVRDYVVTRKEINDLLIDTCTYSVLIISLIISLLFYLLMDIFVGDKSQLIKDVLLVLLLLPTFSAINIIQTALLQRNFKYKSLSIRGLISTTVSGLIGVYFAYQGYGAWALVITHYCRVFINTAILQYVVRYVPRLHFSLCYFKECYRFSLPLLGSEVLNFWSSRVMELFVSVFHGVTNLAILNIARKFTKLIQQLTLSSLRPVVLSYVSASEKQSYEFSKFVGYSTLLVSPLLVAVGIYAEFYITFIFGEQWRPAEEIVEVLSFTAIAQCLAWFFGLILISNNKTSSVLKLNIAFTLFYLAIGAASFNVSFYTYIAIQSIAINVISIFKIYYLVNKKYILIKHFNALILPSVCSSIVFAVISLLSREIIYMYSESEIEWLATALSVLFFAVTYSLTLLVSLLLFKEFQEDVKVIFKKIKTSS